MKRGFRITLWILAAIIILLLALVVAVQSPTVQTALARKAITMLSDKIDGDITVGRISIRPFDAITLDNVIVRDRAPYSDGNSPRQHTLLSVGHLSARFSVHPDPQGEHEGQDQLQNKLLPRAQSVRFMTFDLEIIIRETDTASNPTPISPNRTSATSWKPARWTSRTSPSG